MSWSCGARTPRVWLQGQVSQDLGTLAVGHSAETLVLSPQGKVDSYCRATMLADDVVLLDTGTGYGELLLQRLRRFRLRVKGRARERDCSLPRGARPGFGCEPPRLGTGARGHA